MIDKTRTSSSLNDISTQYVLTFGKTIVYIRRYSLGVNLYNLINVTKYYISTNDNIDGGHSVQPVSLNHRVAYKIKTRLQYMGVTLVSNNNPNWAR